MVKIIIKDINLMYFSPTDTNKKIASKIASFLGDSLDLKVNEINFTTPDARKNFYSFSQNSFLIIACPVYAGRLPNLLLPFLQNNIKGNNTPAACLVTYGNRNFDDALIELKDILDENNFITIAAGAFIGEHSFSKILAANRPDAKDFDVINDFSRKILEKIKTLEVIPSKSIKVAGNVPIRPYYKPRDKNGNFINILKVKPITNDSCIKCGLCIRVCPMGAIPKDNPLVVTGVCIKCCACEKKCPVNAKYFEDKGYLYHKHELEEMYARRAEPEIFI